MMNDSTDFPRRPLPHFVRRMIAAACATTLLCGLAQHAHAQDATWNLNPINGDWNTASNWTPAIVPVTTATFGNSNQTAISFSGSSVGISEIVFSLGASAYTFTLSSGHALSFQGPGIANNSGVAQNFVATGDGAIFFLNFSRAGDSTTLLTAEASPTSGGSSGTIDFPDFSSGGNATIVSGGSAVANAASGLLEFTAGSTAAMANITNQAGTGSGGLGGACEFSGTASADHSLITCAGATVGGAGGGTLVFENTSIAANSTLIANGGLNGGAGGSIRFEDGSKGGSARVEVFSNGSLEISAHNATAVTIGSLEGTGQVFLGKRKLSIGANNLSTTFSGVIQDTGSLTKLGSGLLTLGGANTYSGATTVSSGRLKVTNQTGSATGTGNVTITAGTIGGKGIIAGTVTVGAGSGAGAFLEPGVGAGRPTQLTIQSALIFKADGTYTYKLNTRKAKADQVMANGVTIESGAQFVFNAIANNQLIVATEFTAISNTSATPISGTFANLVDGSTFSVGKNTYQVSYEGGDGNDLTLTVVP